MTRSDMLQLATVIEKQIGDTTHHQRCNSHDGGKCDCYARSRINATEALGALVNELERHVRQDIA